jgi:hypothetical protein
METEYSLFVAAAAPPSRRGGAHHRNECLRDPQANTTYQPAIDASLRLHLDCADLPYVLRASASACAAAGLEQESSTHACHVDATLSVHGHGSTSANDMV